MFVATKKKEKREETCVSDATTIQWLSHQAIEMVNCAKKTPNKPHLSLDTHFGQGLNTHEFYGILSRITIVRLKFKKKKQTKSYILESACEPYHCSHLLNIFNSIKL